MPAPEGLDQLANALDGASKGDINNMPSQLYSALATYINSRILSFLISVAIVVTIIFVFYGSFQYFTAYGDENKAASAKKSITYAFIGLLISLMAMGIATYVQRSITGSVPASTGVTLPVDTR